MIEAIIYISGFASGVGFLSLFWPKAKELRKLKPKEDERWILASLIEQDERIKTLETKLGLRSGSERE